VLFAARIIAIVGALIGIVGGIVGGPEGFGLGGLLLAIALAIATVQVFFREPPAVVEMLDAADGAEQSPAAHPPHESGIIDTSRELKRKG
jgi:hypothetical protein